MPRECRVCGAEFTPRAHNASVCSKSCGRQRDREYNRAWMAAQPPERKRAAFARWYAEHRAEHIARVTARRLLRERPDADPRVAILAVFAAAQEVAGSSRRMQWRRFDGARVGAEP